MNPSIEIMLIEDHPPDATLFIHKLQQNMGDEVQVHWVKTLAEAYRDLETGKKYDQIWLDPGLPDLIAQTDINRALLTLKKYVEQVNGELHIITSSASPGVIAQAENHQVNIVEKDALLSRDSQILQIVGDMLAKKSGGYGTVKVQAAKMEGTIAKLEYQVVENFKRLERVEANQERFSTLLYEISAIKEMVNKIPAIEKKLEKSEGANEIKLKRWDFFQTVLIAFISAAVTLGGIALPKLLDQAKDADPKPSVTETSPPHP